MRLLKLFWDAIYVFALGGVAAAGYGICKHRMKKRIEDRQKGEMES